MTTPKHTLGPWLTDDAHPGDVHRYVLTEDGRVIARVSLLGAPDGEDNARIIKAAPRMLVALQECHTILSTFAAAVPPPPEVADAIDNAARAIEEATATGRWA